MTSPDSCRGAERFRNFVKMLSVFLAVAGLSSQGCSGDRTLAGGYVLKYMNGCEVRIYHPGMSNSGPNRAKKQFGKGCGLRPGAGDYTLSGTMINGNIESYAVREPYITGWASTKCLDTKLEAACEGYFLLNSQTHEVFVGMSPEEWKSELEHIGWSNPALRQLRKP